MEQKECTVTSAEGVLLAQEPAVPLTWVLSDFSQLFLWARLAVGWPWGAECEQSVLSGVSL